MAPPWTAFLPLSLPLYLIWTTLKSLLWGLKRALPEISAKNASIIPIKIKAKIFLIIINRNYFITYYLYNGKHYNVRGTQDM